MKIVEVYLPPGSEHLRHFYKSNGILKFIINVVCPQCGVWHDKQLYCGRICFMKSRSFKDWQNPVHPILIYLNDEKGGEKYLLAEIEKETIIRVLRQCNGHKSRAAEMLGITRRSIYNKLEEYGMHIKKIKR